MIASDTSTLIHFVDGRTTRQTTLLANSMKVQRVSLPPVVVAEFLSWPLLRTDQAAILDFLDELPVEIGFWARAGRLRAAVHRAGRKAKLGDTLVAQACLDADLPLLTSDSDFSAFQTVAGLRLA